MNGKDLKFILPVAVVVVIILSIIGIAIMSGSKDDDNGIVEEGSYNLLLGPVQDEGGDPLTDVKVTLTSGDAEYSVLSDIEGFANFSFDEKPVFGEYTLTVELEDHEMVRKNVTLGFTDGEIKLSGMAGDGSIVLPSIVLPPLELSVGPVTSENGTLTGASVKLLKDGELIAEAPTDLEGKVTFTFDEAPADGDYLLDISLAGFITTENEINLIYDEETHALNVSGNISDLTLEVIMAEPEPVEENDPEYFKELPVYEELEDAREVPVDVEEIMDEDGDGTPEYLDDIKKETRADVEVDDYVGVDQQGDPEYSPEITSFEAIEPEDYMDAPGGTRGGRNGVGNLTHYSDIVRKEDILDNGTEEIMKYDTEAVNPAQSGAFQSEVGRVGIIIEEVFEANFTNGTNSTDRNNDGHPEALVMWKVVTMGEDRDGDNVSDHRIVALQVLRVWDNNSNGVWENSKGFSAVLIEWDNNSDGFFEESKRMVAAGEEAKVDGNLTDHFKRVAIYYNHTIDMNNDTHYELHRAALYVQEYYDNNSNGHYEYGKEFAGGFEGYDEDSNGVSEHVLLVWAGKELEDSNDDGNYDVNRSVVWIYGYEDPNEDGFRESQNMLVIINENFDNNSNGNCEDVKQLIGGFLVLDNNSDGAHERRDAVLAFTQEWDRNDDGSKDANVSFGRVFLWKDADGDGTPEYQRALIYIGANYDNNSNGHFELSRQLIMGFLVEDPDDDGVENKVMAVSWGIEKEDMNDNGNLDHYSSSAFVLEAEDANGDGNPEYKHAVFAAEEKWDNNTDGVFEAVNMFVAGYLSWDEDDDGVLDEEKFFIIANQTSDANGDGNPECSKMSVLATHREYNPDGTIARARNVVHFAVGFDNNSNGNYELAKSIVLGHQGWNGTQNGSKVDWETEHVLLLYDEKKDTDDDGVWDDHNFVKVEF